MTSGRSANHGNAFWVIAIFFMVIKEKMHGIGNILNTSWINAVIFQGIRNAGCDIPFFCKIDQINQIIRSFTTFPTATMDKNQKRSWFFKISRLIYIQLERSAIYLFIFDIFNFLHRFWNFRLQVCKFFKTHGNSEVIEYFKMIGDGCFFWKQKSYGSGKQHY